MQYLKDAVDKRMENWKKTELQKLEGLGLRETLKLAAKTKIDHVGRDMKKNKKAVILSAVTSMVKAHNAIDKKDLTAADIYMGSFQK